MILQTRRLTVRRALPQKSDIELYYNLWTDPQVMHNVGFPDGLSISREDIDKQLQSQSESEFDRLLVVELTESAIPIGECKLGAPDSTGIAHTDIKLLPHYWGQGLGSELKPALLEYLFKNTDCKIVQATPNLENTASQKMQEAAGLRRVGQDVYRFPENMRVYTRAVHHYIYQISRADWEKSRK